MNHQEPAQKNTDPWEAHHSSVRHFRPLFEFGHLPGHLVGISQFFSDLADELVMSLLSGPELAVALRKLLEAKDAAVRQRVLDMKLSQALEGSELRSKMTDQEIARAMINQAK